MIRFEMLQGKVHGALVTHKDLHYTGSLSVDGDLLDAAGMIHNQKVQVVNLVNGERLWTYLLRHEAGSGVIGLNGGMALKGEEGDRLLLITYAEVDAEGAAELDPKVVVVGEDNRTFEVLKG